MLNRRKFLGYVGSVPILSKVPFADTFAHCPKHPETKLKSMKDWLLSSNDINSLNFLFGKSLGITNYEYVRKRCIKCDSQSKPASLEDYKNTRESIKSGCEHKEIYNTSGPSISDPAHMEIARCVRCGEGFTERV